MFKKKFLVILLFLIIAVCAVSAVNAEEIGENSEIISEDNAIEEVSVDESIQDDSVGENAMDEKLGEDASSEVVEMKNENAAEITIKESDEKTLTSKNTDKEILSTSDYDLKVSLVKQTGKYASDKKLYFKVVDAVTGEGWRTDDLEIEYYDGILKEWIPVDCDLQSTTSKGIAVLKWSKTGLGSGTYKIRASTFFSYSNTLQKKITVLKKVKVAKKPVSVTIKPTKLSTTYKSGKYFKAKVINSKTNKPVKGVKVTLKVFTGKNAKTVTLTSNSKGIIKYSSSKLKVGKHNVVLKVKKSKSFTGKTKKSYIKISKKKSSSNTAKKGKTSTTITCKGSILKNSYTYQSGYYTSPRGQEPLYNTAYYPSVSITPTLKGSNGKEIKGKYKATLNYYDSDGELYHSETFDGTFGQYKSYTGSNGGWKYNLKISYSGNSKYRASSFTTSITMNNHGPVKM